MSLSKNKLSEGVVVHLILRKIQLSVRIVGTVRGGQTFVVMTLLVCTITPSEILPTN